MPQMDPSEFNSTDSGMLGHLAEYVARTYFGNYNQAPAENYPFLAKWYQTMFHDPSVRDMGLGASSPMQDMSASMHDAVLGSGGGITRGVGQVPYGETAETYPGAVNYGKFVPGKNMSWLAQSPELRLNADATLPDLLFRLAQANPEYRKLMPWLFGGDTSGAEKF